MTYYREKPTGSVPYPHKLRVLLRQKIQDVLSRYSLDEVLSEIADQRPSFHIHSTPAIGSGNGPTFNTQSGKAEKTDKAV